MMRLAKHALGSQKGQALPMVLALLAIGGLTIAANLDYATANIHSTRILREKTAGIYAAGAGVAEAIWSLENGQPPPAQLSENVNDMAVAINTDNMGTRTLVLEGWTTLQGEHYYYVSVSKSVTWNATANAYLYAVTATRQPGATGNIKIENLGVRIPIGYSYQGTPAPSGMSTEAPAQSGDIESGYVFQWNWSGGDRPTLSDATPQQTQTFFISGTGSTDKTYTWVGTDRLDVGLVGEFTGILYSITATARRPQDGRVMAEIQASDTMMIGGTAYVFSWQITE